MKYSPARKQALFFHIFVKFYWNHYIQTPTPYTSRQLFWHQVHQLQEQLQTSLDPSVYHLHSVEFLDINPLRVSSLNRMNRNLNIKLVVLSDMANSFMYQVVKQFSLIQEIITNVERKMVKLYLQTEQMEFINIVAEQLAILELDRRLLQHLTLVKSIFILGMS